MNYLTYLYQPIYGFQLIQKRSNKFVIFYLKTFARFNKKVRWKIWLEDFPMDQDGFEFSMLKTKDVFKVKFLQW